MAAAASHINALAANALHHILLTATTHDNLLRFVAACAHVWGEWWRVVGGSAAYGRGLGAGEERARVLKAITEAIEAEGGTLDLGNQRIGDAGAAALGAALQAMPRVKFAELDLAQNDLTAVGAASLAPALRRPGLRELRLVENPSLGDGGVATLAKALPHTLEDLRLNGTGCGDGGLVALAAVLPALTRLGALYCGENPAATSRGWVALARALPSLPALTRIMLFHNPGMGAEGAAALVAAVTWPNCPWLKHLNVSHCELGDEDRASIKKLNGPRCDDGHRGRRRGGAMGGGMVLGNPYPDLVATA